MPDHFEAHLVRVDITDIPCGTCDQMLERAFYSEMTPDGVRPMRPMIGCRRCGTCETETSCASA